MVEVRRGGSIVSTVGYITFLLMIARTRVQVNTDSHEGLQVETYSTFLIFSMVPASGRLGNQLQSQRSKGVREQVGEAIRNELVLLKYRRGGARIWFVMYTVATAIDVIDVMLAAGRRARQPIIGTDKEHHAQNDTSRIQTGLEDHAKGYSTVRATDARGSF